MNVRLLRKVKKHILEEPRRFQMETFINRDMAFYRRRNIAPACGTVGCIAGWTCVLQLGDKVPSESEAIFNEAQKLLGLTVRQAKRLFCMYAAPTQFNEMHSGDGKLETAQACAARIEHFIKTKGRE